MLSLNDLAILPSGANGMLLDVLIGSTALLVVASLSAWILRRFSAALRHTIWAMSAVALLAMPLLTFCLPTWDVEILPEAGAQLVQYPVQLDTFDSTRPPTAPIVRTARATHEGSVGRDDSHIHTVEHGVTVGSFIQDAGSADSQRGWMESTAALVPFLWLSVAMIQIVLLLKAMIRTGMLSGRSLAVTDADWLRMATETRERLGIRRNVRLMLADHLAIPITCGVFRPVVLLPRIAEDWDAPLRRVALLHEFAHIKRHDVGFQLIGRLACAVYWFHPLAWWVLRQLREERERACDDCVLRSGVTSPNYAEALVRVARLARSSPNLLAVMMADQTNLERRVRHVLDESQDRSAVSRPRRVAVSIAIAALVAAVVIVRPVPSIGGADDAPVQSDAVEARTLSPNDGPEMNRLDNLEGQVIGRDGKPLVGARVFLREYKSPGSSLQALRDTRTLAEIRTGSDGRFRFQDVLVPKPRPVFMNDPDSPFPLTLVVTADGYTVDWLYVSKEPTEPVKFTPRKAGTIAGRVVDREGKPLPDIRVRVARILPLTELVSFERHGKTPRSLSPGSLDTAWPESPLIVQTAGDGTFSIDGVPRNSGLVLEVFDLDYVPVEAYACANPEHELIRELQRYRDAYQDLNLERSGVLHTNPVEMRVERGARLTVRVIDEETGEPIPHAPYGGDRTELGLPPKQADKDGKFTLGGLRVGDAFALFIHPPHGSEYLRHGELVTLPANSFAAEFTVRLRRGQMVTGTVADKESGEPISDATISYLHPVTYRQGTMQRLVPDRQGIVPTSRTTDARGRFQIAVPGEGGRLSVSHAPGYHRHTEPLSISEAMLKSRKVEDGPLDVRIELNPAPVLRGRIFGPDGQPVPGVKISATEVGKSSSRWGNGPFRRTYFTLSDSEGWFVLKEIYSAQADPRYIPPDGTDAPTTKYEIQFHSPELGLRTKVNAPVVAPEGKSPKPIEVHFKPMTGISGRVVDAVTGTPVSGARVGIRLFADGGLQEIGWPSSTRSDGRFTLSPEPDDEYGVGVTHKDYQEYFPPPDSFSVLKRGERRNIGDIKLLKK